MTWSMVEDAKEIANAARPGCAIVNAEPLVGGALDDELGIDTGFAKAIAMRSSGSRP